MRLKKIITLFFILSSVFVFSQNENQDIKGDFYGDVFLNTNLNTQNTQISFRLNRLHFGYKYQFTDNLYFNGMIESAREDYDPVTDYNGITNLFEFCLGFSLDKLDGKFGLIGTELNQQQEKLWKHRYVDKVFADKYGFSPTNDFGFLLIYKPTDFLNIDFSVTNGEGHKAYQADSAFRYATGITVKSDNGFVGRVFGDMVYYPDVQQSNFIGILGYDNGDLSIGAEWNQQFNSGNSSDYKRSGISAYFSYGFLEKYQLFGRYDYIYSNELNNQPTSWNVMNDGKLIIGGVQYLLNEKIKLAINNRSWISEIDESVATYLFFDIELAF